MNRWLAFVVAIIAMATALPASGLSKSEPATTLHLYAPFNAGGLSIGTRVARTARGSCWTTSELDQRSDAWRCLVGNSIYDPCFSDGVGALRFVVCPRGHPGAKVVRIRLTAELPPANTAMDPTKYPPWAVRLPGGTWCTLIGGATGSIAGMRLNYGCADGAVLLGNPHRATPVWTIPRARSMTSSQFTIGRISAAWW